MIEQAKGVLAERHHVTPDEAFLILRRYARDHNRPLTALAGDVIHGIADIGPGSQLSSRLLPGGLRLVADPPLLPRLSKACGCVLPH
jgi:hypothetical protein